MATWRPADAIRDSEIIGRRIFDRSANKDLRVQDVPNIFMDTRIHEDLSFDRLGDGQVHKATVLHLTKLSDDAATATGHVFGGWFATKRKNIKQVNLRPDVLTLERDGINNPFHSLLDRSSAREKSLAFFLSRSLLMDFKETGEIVLPMRKVPKVPGQAA